MGYKLIPPPDECDNSLANATPKECVAAWIKLMKEHDEQVLARLREEIGPEGDLRAAYRAWYAKQCEEHTKDLTHMLTELHRRENARITREGSSNSTLPVPPG